jgi:hypothetical protein
MPGVKSLMIMLFLLMFSSVAIAQSYMRNPYGMNQGRNRSLVPRTNNQPSQEDYDKMLQEQLEAHINNYMSDLEVDEFQKHIIRQKLESYYSQRLSILKNDALDVTSKRKSIEHLNNNHFNDIKDITTEEVQESIQQFIQSKPSATNKKKEKRKKKKKRDKG